jgi:hypothetical protein
MPLALPSPRLWRTNARIARWAFLKAAVVYYASLGLTIQRVTTDNGSCYRSKAFAKPVRSSASNTSGPSLTRPRPTARPNASSTQAYENGLMPALTRPPSNAPPSCQDGFTATMASPSWQYRIKATDQQTRSGRNNLLRLHNAASKRRTISRSFDA